MYDQMEKYPSITVWSIFVLSADRVWLLQFNEYRNKCWQQIGIAFMWWRVHRCVHRWWCWKICGEQSDLWQNASILRHRNVGQYGNNQVPLHSGRRARLWLQHADQRRSRLLKCKLIALRYTSIHDITYGFVFEPFFNNFTANCAYTICSIPISMI